MEYANAGQHTGSAGYIRLNMTWTGQTAVLYTDSEVTRMRHSRPTVDRQTDRQTGFVAGGNSERIEHPLQSSDLSS